MRQARGTFLRERVQAAKGRQLCFAGEPATTAVEDEKHSPRWRKRHPRDHRRMTAGTSASAIDDKAALLEGPNADTGPRAAVRSGGDCGNRKRNIEERAERLANR